MGEWHYVKGGAQAGPVTFEELKAMAADGRLDRADKVWKAGLETWTQAGGVAGLFPDSASPVEYAGFGIRAAARVLDYVLCFVLGLFGGLFAGVVIGVMTASGRMGPDTVAKIHAPGGSTTLFALLSMIAFHTLAEGLSGATPGKFLCGLRVLGADRSPCGVGAAAVRSAAFLVDSLFFGIVGYSRMKKSPEQQRYGDAWAKTVVVKAAGVPDASRRGVVAAFALAAFAAMALDAAGLFVKALL